MSSPASASQSKDDPGSPQRQAIAQQPSEGATVSAAAATTPGHLSPSHVQVCEELAFLSAPECNPNSNDEASIKQGNIRRSARERTSSHDVHHFRQLVRFIAYSTPFQAIVVLVIMLDLVATSLSLAGHFDESHSLFLTFTWIIISVLALDVGSRFYVEQCAFLRGKMNIFELVLVPLALTEILLLRNLDLPLPLLRALRPAFRFVRVVRVLVRGLGKGSEYLRRIRRRVSGDRIRYSQDGFDLDLCYVSGQIISMSVPAVGRERLFRNPHSEVARFLNEKHFNKYLLVNLTQSNTYPTMPFFGRCYHFPIPVAGVPALDGLLRLCQILDSFLKADPENVVALHSKNSQGRVCLVTGALLLYRGAFQTAASTISHLEVVRMDLENRASGNVQTFDSASQKRFFECFAHMVAAQGSMQPLERTAKLVKIEVFGLSDMGSIDISGHALMGMRPDEVGVLQKMRSATSAAHVSVEVDGGLGTEDAIEEALEDKVLAMSDMQLLSGMQSVLDEGTFDSVSSGSFPLAGNPVFSSNPSSGFDSDVTVRVQDQLRTVPGVWQIGQAEFGSEFRLEVHRRKPPDRPGQAKKRRGFGWFKPKSSPLERAKFEGGMLFGCFLHTGYLELQEPAEMTSSLQHTNTVVVVLDQFGIDKAAKAPPLRGYSSNFKIQLEFEVERRLNLKAEAKAQTVAPVVISSLANSSDVYPMGWLTWVAERIWPNFQNGLEKLITDDIMPNLQQSLPGPLKNIKLKHCSFGSGSPVFGPVSACSRSHDGLEVQLDIGLNYQTDTNIVLDAGIAAFSIGGLKLKGMLSVKFKPILQTLPVFASIQLLFLNSPEIDLKFGNALEIANSSLVRSIIFGAVNSAIYDLMVLPNIICINWADTTNDNAVSFTNVMPCAVLRLGVVEGRNLQAESAFFKRVPASQVHIKLGQAAAKTASITNTSMPVWNESFDFLLYDERQQIQIKVQDSDFAGRMRSIGTADIQVAALIEAGQDGLWVELMDAPRAAGGAQSQVLISAAVYDLAADSKMLEDIMSAAEPQANAIETGGQVAADEQQDGEDQTEELAVPRQRLQDHAGAVALLVCEIHGGHVPPQICTPEEWLQVKVVVGKRSASQTVVKASELDPGSISEKSIKCIHRLVGHGMAPHQIAHVLGEELSDVQRIIRKSAWNIEVPQKVCVMMHASDLVGAASAQVMLLNKKDRLATGKIQLDRIFRVSGTRASELVPCIGVDGNSSVRMEIDFRAFALVPRGFLGTDEAQGTLAETSM